MVTASKPSASARAVAAATTCSTLNCWLGPCRDTAAGSCHSSRSVRVGSPAPVRGDGIGNTSSVSVRCTLYKVQSNAPSSPGGPVRITASAVSLNVDDVAASAQFLTAHFGFQEKMAADGFAALTRDDAGMD